jgi:hypothetical protein
MIGSGAESYVSITQAVEQSQLMLLEQGSIGLPQKIYFVTVKHATGLRPGLTLRQPNFSLFLWLGRLCNEVGTW